MLGSAARSGGLAGPLCAPLGGARLPALRRSGRLCASASRGALGGARRQGLGSRRLGITCSAAPGGPSAGEPAPNEVFQVAAIPQRYRPDQAAAVAGEAAAQAAQGIDAKFNELRKAVKGAYDRIYYGDVMPPLGSFQISYARLLQLLHDKRVKRLILMSDGRTAVVEVPVENTETDFETIVHDRRDLTLQYAEEVPEWKMEKNRYYVELPGDVWEEGTLLHLIKDAQEKRVYIDGVLRVPYDSLLKVHQVRPELQVVDPGDAYVWLNEFSSQFVPIVGLLLLRGVVGAGEWVLKKMGREKKSEQEELAETLGRHRAKEYNVDEGGKKGKGTKKSTGVRYEDVAGIDHIKEDVREVLDILMGDEIYLAMGAHPVRGVLLEGPPGTGKTLLAKAMAGEAGIPFYSANGAEFVEMFQGVAAARIRSLFRTARKNSPSIIFIDEIDAIGKARSSDGFTDSGTQEREQGLLQLLTEMDGFYQDDQVLVVAATNRADALDDALLRPGRFDRTIFMGRPSPSNRLRILQVHARNKPIDRSNDDALLRQIAELAIGYSGAELANLLNEGAILAVRRNKAEIDLPILKEAMDKVRLGLPHQSIPDSAAKRQYAAIEAARAVAFALTPGLPPIEHVTIRPRGGAVTRILFVPQEFGRDGGMWHRLSTPAYAANAVALDEPLGQLEVACGLLTPLYAARACEEVIYGPEAASLSTSKEISKAGELARWIVMDSGLHPATRDDVVLANIQPGGMPDPTTKWAGPSYDDLILDLQRRAYEASLRLVAQRRSMIEAVARELCENSDETVLGSRIVELLQSTPLDEIPEELLAGAAGGDGSPPEPEPEAAAAAEAAAADAAEGHAVPAAAEAPAAAAAAKEEAESHAAPAVVASSRNGASSSTPAAAAVGEGFRLSGDGVEALPAAAAPAAAAAVVEPAAPAAADAPAAAPAAEEAEAEPAAAVPGAAVAVLDGEPLPLPELPASEAPQHSAAQQGGQQQQAGGQQQREQQEARTVGGGEAAAREALGPEVTGSDELVRLAEIVMGRVEEWDLLPGSKARSKAQRVREQLLDPTQRQRLEAIRRFATAEPDAARFPPPPPPAELAKGAPRGIPPPPPGVLERQGMEDFLPKDGSEVLNL